MKKWILLISSALPTLTTLATDPPPPSMGPRPAIHVFVALCDNANQGIVPVPAALGNGDDPANNLYWGAMYGVKSWFKRSDSWELVSTKAPVNDTILERIVFKHKQTGIHLMADAYRGREIKKAVVSFFGSASGQHRRTLMTGENGIGVYGNAALIAYIGHNGLMDFKMDLTMQASRRAGPPAAIVLACRSEPYFGPALELRGCSPRLLTTNFMAPEAYTLEAAIEVWLKQEGAAAMQEAAAKAYNHYQKCGLNGARRLFRADE